jgi:methyl-accepting chemotaxis protein
MSNDKKALRKRLFVDPKVQGALIARVVLYWVACLITIALMLLCWDIITGPTRLFYMHFDDMWFYYGPPAIASCLLLPLVIVDIIRLSNRFVGPLLRLRRSMRALARGENVEPIEFRGGDFWHDLADEFNAVRARIRQLSARNESEIEDEEPLGIGL